MFESSDPSTKIINATDSRFFWIALYAHPLLWFALAFVAIFGFSFIWLTLVGRSCYTNKRGERTDVIIVIALSLTVTNTLAFSRCDKFGQASNLAGNAFSTGNLASNLASGMVGRFFSRS